MNRSDAACETFSSKIASRPLRAAIAVKIAVIVIGANMSLAAARVYFSQSMTPVGEAGVSMADMKPNCRDVVVETDEGYGVRGTVTRTVCGKAL